MIDIKRIDDQIYLRSKMVEIDRSPTPIIDISTHSAENKSKVIAMYDKLKFNGMASKTPLVLSILVDAPKAVVQTIDLSDSIDVIATDSIENILEEIESDEDGIDSDTPKRKKRR